MRIRPVTVGALLKCQCLPEIPFGVALHAVDLCMLAEQREPGPGMIKSKMQPRRRNLAPSRRAVTGLAGLRKPATVGISMAIGAVAEGYSGVTRLFIRTGSVALLASDLGMQAREGIACT